MIKSILRSNFVWRLTGLTYPTAVIATNGYYVKRNDLISLGRRENLSLLKYLSREKSLLEFGSGIGKNLFAISPYVKIGYGINNVRFLQYDGKTFPEMPKFDIIYENGVFERIPKNSVRTYLKLLSERYLMPGGMMILYFLSENAKNIGFTKKLGDEAYIFWNRTEIDEMVSELHMHTLEVQEWPMAYVYILSSTGGAV